ncbi:MAG: aspartate/glutamate racemase family protein [Acidobacteriota bacterium]
MLTIGVLGGMGPAAAADFYQRLVMTHGAQRDQDHPPCILFSATQIPDRTAHLLGEGPDPSSALAAAARVLESAGADLIAIPCNSAHAYLQVIRAAVAIPVLDMIAIAVAAVEKQRPGAGLVGLLAASGTVRLGLYDEPLRRAGYAVLKPEPKIQKQVMEAIRAVKGGGQGTDGRLVNAAVHLVELGAEALLLGCTEVPLGLDLSSCPVAAVDANQSLVEATLGLATGALQPQDIAHGAGVRERLSP